MQSWCLREGHSYRQPRKQALCWNAFPKNGGKDEKGREGEGKGRRKGREREREMKEGGGEGRGWKEKGREGKS